MNLLRFKMAYSVCVCETQIEELAGRETEGGRCDIDLDMQGKSM